VGADVSDPDGAWDAVSGIAAEGAVLVRPDQYVAWRSTGPAPDPGGVLAGVLAGLGRRP